MLLFWGSEGGVAEGWMDADDKGQAALCGLPTMLPSRAAVSCGATPMAGGVTVI